MKRIKNLIIWMFGLSLGFSSCNKNDANPIYISLPIVETFEPMMKEIIIYETNDKPSFREHVYVVNSIDELPNDYIFGNDEFLDKDIDFSQYSLIIFYDHEFGKIVSTRCRWVYATDFNKYQVSISYEIEKGSDVVDGEFDLVTYVRGAMLVDQIPSSSDVIMSVGVFGVDPK